MRVTTLVLVVALALGASSCDGAQDARSGAAATEAAEAPAGGSVAGSADRDTGWIALFDGTDLAAWRGYLRTDPPGAWRVMDRELVFVPGGDGGDIITRQQFGDFELALEWRVGPAGNSGVFYRASEDFEVIWYGAPEAQVLDDARHPDGGDPITSSGALYALYPPTAEVVNPAGEWNAFRVVARGPRVEHWLNGVRVVEYEAWTDDWYGRVAASKFAEYPGFGEARTGHIGLQDHGDTVWYRDIRVRPIRDEDR